MTAFCSDLSRAAGEPLPGTGAHPACNLLIRWPKGGWGENLAVAPAMPTALVAAIETLRDGGRRVNLIDRKGEETGRHRLYLYPERVTRDVSRSALPSAIEAVARGDLGGWTVQDRPILLACTHGRKDRCCAKFGFATYRALADAAARGGPEVWESTHLGGCRLSGSVLAFPALRKYGRVRPADADALLADEARDRPWLPSWRGPSCVSPEAQAVAHAAEVWARERGGQVVGMPAPDADGWRVIVDLPANRVVKAYMKTYVMARPATCADLDVGVLSEGVAWTVTLRSR